MNIIVLLSSSHFLHVFLVRIIIYKSKNHYILISKGGNNCLPLQKLTKLSTDNFNKGIK